MITFIHGEKLCSWVFLLATTKEWIRLQLCLAALQQDLPHVPHRTTTQWHTETVCDTMTSSCLHRCVYVIWERLQIPASCQTALYTCQNQRKNLIHQVSMTVIFSTSTPNQHRHLCLCDASAGPTSLAMLCGLCSGPYKACSFGWINLLWGPHHICYWGSTDSPHSHHSTMYVAFSVTSKDSSKGICMLTLFTVICIISQWLTL